MGPTKIKGVGAGRAADLRYIESVGRTVAQYANRPKIIIEKSTVPVKTAEALERVVTANQGASQKFWILSNPEFHAWCAPAQDLLHRRRLCRWPNLRDHRFEVSPCQGHHRGLERGSTRVGSISAAAPSRPWMVHMHSS